MTSSLVTNEGLFFYLPTCPPTRPRSLSVDFITYFMVIQTKSYIFHISTSPKSICDETTAKKVLISLQTSFFWTWKQLFAIHFLLVTNNVRPWRSQSSLHITGVYHSFTVYILLHFHTLTYCCQCLPPQVRHLPAQAHINKIACELPYYDKIEIICLT